MTTDYKSSVFLPKTDFPMRGGLPKKEPELLKRWADMKLFHRLREESELPIAAYNVSGEYAMVKAAAEKEAAAIKEAAEKKAAEAAGKSVPLLNHADFIAKERATHDERQAALAARTPGRAADSFPMAEAEERWSGIRANHLSALGRALLAQGLQFRFRQFQQALQYRVGVLAHLGRLRRDERLLALDHHRERELVGAEALLRWDHPARGTLHPDEFLLQQLELEPLVVLPAFKVMRARLKNPAFTPTAFVDAMERNGLVQTAAFLGQALQLI